MNTATCMACGWQRHKHHHETRRQNVSQRKEQSLEPLVSVIIPVYNVYPYLQEALDSVISQIYQNLEILIIDDGSNDGSEVVCDAYQQKDSRITVIHQENRGLGGARNTGLGIAKGELIAFLDSDDVYEPETIRLLVEKLQMNGADICICGYRHFYIQSDNTKTSTDTFSFNSEKQITSREALAELAQNTINPAVWNKIYRRELWDGIRFSESVFFEDICVMCKLLERARTIQLIEDVLIRYRIRPDSITHMGTQKHIHDYIQAHDQYESHIRSNIPEIYNDRQYQQVQERHIDGLFILWSRQNRTDRITAKSLRREITRRIRGLKTEYLTTKTRIKYWTMCFCPGLFPVMLSVYRYIR